MPLHDSLAVIPSEPRVVTIGAFDGVHLGHQHLLRSAVNRARHLGLPSMAVTFEPLPAAVVRPDTYRGRICTADEKLGRIIDCGVDDLVVIPFTIGFSRTSAAEFFAALRSTGMAELWVGEGFAMGKDRAGNLAMLHEMGTQSGIEVEAVQRLESEGAIVSSSAIRQAIIAGESRAAWQGLGRPFRVQGEVIHGAHLGREIGYPTANIRPPEGLVELADGIYASYTHLPGESLPRPSMTYVGTRPTVDDGARLIETHLLDFEGDLYGQVISVDILDHLRHDQTFAGLEQLIDQLKLDEAMTRQILAANKPESLTT